MRSCISAFLDDWLVTVKIFTRAAFIFKQFFSLFRKPSGTTANEGSAIYVTIPLLSGNPANLAGWLNLDTEFNIQ